MISEMKMCMGILRSQWVHVMRTPTHRHRGPQPFALLPRLTYMVSNVHIASLAKTHASAQFSTHK